MANRIDELQGQVKKGVGSLIGNEELRHEGEAQRQKAKLEREAEGAIDQAVGKAQETVGDVTDDTETELKGKARQTQGEVKRSG